MNEQTYQKLNRYSALAIQIFCYLLIISFALSGIGIIIISIFTWLISDASWIAGFGLITGGIILSSAATLIIGKLLKDGDTLQRKFIKKLNA